MKAIVFVRCSTEKQELASQIQETTAYAQHLGYNEFTVIGAKGASAVKLNDIYNEKINELFHTIEQDKGITAVVVWHLNRIARNEEMAMKVKNFLIQHNVQLHVKEPTITLLNEDKTVNTGAELAFSLFATMAKQQAEELRKKSSRGLQRNIELKKYTGGKILYGYYVDAQGFTHIDPVEGKIVKEIYEEYAKDTYSYQTLQKEINARYGLEFSTQWYRQKIGNETYYNGHGYDPIITEELFNKCLEIRTKRDKPMIQKYNSFCNRILKCSCGRGYTLSRSRVNLIYRCSGCGQGERISTANLDGLVWMIASNLEANYLQTTDTNKELRQKQAVLASKIKTLDKYTSKAEKARQRVKEAYLNGVIELEEYQDRIKKTEIDAEQARKDKERMEDEVRQLQDIIEAKDGKVQKMMDIAGKLQDGTLEEMQTIVRKWIKRITYDEGIVTIDTLGKTYRARYIKNGKKYHWLTLGGNELACVRVDHLKKEVIKPLGVGAQSLVNTIAWLAGSEII